MRHILYAIDKDSMYPFELEVESEEAFERNKKVLEKEGYIEFFLDIRYSNLEEMYKDIEQNEYH